eukprot:51643-Eustigmatos_ZCMA.PRE.1
MGYLCNAPVGSRGPAPSPPRCVTVFKVPAETILRTHDAPLVLKHSATEGGGHDPPGVRVVRIMYADLLAW